MSRTIPAAVAREHRETTEEKLLARLQSYVAEVRAHDVTAVKLTPVARKMDLLASVCTEYGAL